MPRLWVYNKVQSKMIIEPSITESNCNKCKLYTKSRMQFTKMSKTNCDVLIISDVPEFSNEDLKLLQDVLDGFDINNVAYTSVIKCKPLGKIYKKHVSYCHKYVMSDIENSGAKIVLLMGNNALNSITGESGITNWNGILIDSNYKYLPVYHPTYIQHNSNALDLWLDAFEKVRDILDDKYKVHNNRQLIYPESIEDIEYMLQDLMNYDVVAYDTETSTLDPFNDGALLLSISFSIQESDGSTVSYAVPLEHIATPFNDNELVIVKQMLCKFFKGYKGIITGHNIKFDWQWTKRIIGCEFNSGGDTLLMSYLLGGKSGNGLKRLAGLYLGMYNYDKPLRDYCKAHKEADVMRGGSYANVPLDLLLGYGALDTDASIRLYFILRKKLTESQRYLHDELLANASDALAQMEYNGIALDDYIVDK